MTATPWKVRDVLADRITALTPAADYRQETSAAWRLAIDPMIDAEPGSRAHLSFWVDDTVQQTDLHRGNASEGAHIAAPVDVVFLYRMRPRKETDDWDASAKAAAAIHKTLIDFDPVAADIANPPFTVQPGPALVDRAVPASGWLRVTVQFTVIYQLSLDAT